MMGTDFWIILGVITNVIIILLAFFGGYALGQDSGIKITKKQNRILNK